MPYVQCVLVCARSHGHEQGLFFSQLRSDGQRAWFFQSLAALRSASWHILRQERQKQLFQPSAAIYLVCLKMDTRQDIWKLIESRCNAQDDCRICRCALKNHHTFNAIWGSCDYSSSTCRSTVPKQPVPVLTLTEKFLEDIALNAQGAVLVLLGLDIGQLISPS